MDRILGYRLLVVALVACVAGSVLLAAPLLAAKDDSAAVDEEAQFDMAANAEDSEQADDGGEEGALAPESSRDEEPTAGADEGGSSGMGSLLRIVAILVMVVFAVGVIGTLTTGLVVSEGIRTGVLLALAGPLIGVFLKGESSTLTRGRILGFVEAHPGIHFSALRDALGLANGVTSHHIHILEKEGRVLSWADGIRRRYAVSGIDPKTINTLEHPVTGMQRAILQILADTGAIGLSTSELRTHLEASRQLMAYHLKRLEERDLLAKQGKGRKACWSLTTEGDLLLKAQVTAAI
jgi:DNA-binding MarR family transcriptional regulator